MQLAAIALSLFILLGLVAPVRVFAQAASPRSQLPATQPGLSRQEGVFLVTTADDGSQLVYFIAQNTRHSTTSADLLNEQQLNSLWPVWLASHDDVLAFPEAAPVGSARIGLLTGPEMAEPNPDGAEPTVAAEVTAAPVEDAAASEDALTYVVKAGDSVIRIARRFGVDVDELLAVNSVANRNRVYIGQVLDIPQT